MVGDSTYGIVPDHLGTPLAMYDVSEHEAWTAELGVYGQIRTLEGLREACPFRWPGQYEDTETGLYYNRFRYYDVEAGEYISQDPIGLLAGLRAYGYVASPLVWVDPLGLVSQGREFRLDWLEVNEFDPKQPRHVRGWLQQERNRTARGRATTPRTPPGYVLAHGRTTPAREGFDYSNARLSWEYLNKVEERMRRRLEREQRRKGKTCG
jgi:RHS repeat-associated protein